MAMMPSVTAGNPYENDPIIEQDLIDPDGGPLVHYQTCTKSMLLIWSPDNDADDPVQITSDRTPLTGNIHSSSSSRTPVSQSYLTSSIPGEDRRAPQNTIDESVWKTVSRDLLAVWEKMKQVLWPKYLLGGMLRRGGGIAAAERGEMEGFGRGLRGMVGRWPDADGILQGGMSEGLRDWDLWYVVGVPQVPRMLMGHCQGSFGVLSSTQHVPLHGGIDRPRRPHLLGRFLNCLDRGSGRHGTDQASGR